jgi:LAS superfamily LD-carboxypeptidase LdcB
MKENAGQFGWVHPAWAQQGGSKPEPWHWEFVGA